MHERQAERPAHDLYREIGPDYVERLARYWPEPREQLHAGGWASTHEMIRDVRLDRAGPLLDICCGEGGTACFLADRLRRTVVGVDILPEAVRSAAARATARGLADRVGFAVSNIFELPFRPRTFAMVFGQDPDGLAHHRRVIALRRCREILVPGGLICVQHWLPHAGVTSAELQALEEVTARAGYPSMRRFSVGHYRQDLAAAGFVDIETRDLTDMYRSHLERLESVHQEVDGSPLDPWSWALLSLMRVGRRIGARLIARKLG